MPKARALAVAGVSFGSVSSVHLFTSIVKVLPDVNTFSSTKMKTCWLAASAKHATSSEMLEFDRFDAPMQVATVTGVPGVAAGQELATYKTRLSTILYLVTL